MKIALISHHPASGTTYSPAHYMENALRDSRIIYEHFDICQASSIPSGFDLYFRIDHGDYKDDIQADKHPAVFYVIDSHLKKPFKKIAKQARHYDVVFCAQQPSVEPLRKKAKTDVQWVPLGCDPRIHPKLDIPKKYDIGFVGRDAVKFDRGRHLSLLKEKFPNSFIGLTPSTEMTQIYSASKIGFNSSIQNDVNMRVFEILSCGCFLLTNKIKNDGLYEILEEGKHFVTYTHEKDLLDKAGYYLSHDHEREVIARAGHERVLQHYTYFHTLQRIFNYLAFKFGGKFNDLRLHSEFLPAGKNWSQLQRRPH